jgi:phage gpG-like protein
MVQGLRINPGIKFSWFPSLGISAVRVAKFGADIRSWKEPLKKAVKEVMIPSIQQNFDAGGRPEPWQELSDTTYELSPNRMGGPLVSTGRLKQTMKQLNVWTITSTTASIQGLPDSIWYGGIQQGGYGFSGGGFGDENPQYKTSGIPARPFIVIQDEDYDKIQLIFSNYIDKRLAELRIGL